MFVRLSTMLALSVLSVLALGCRDSLSPGDLAGTYVLDHVGNDPVPAVIFHDPQGTVRVIADTLRLDADGGGRFVSVQIIELVDGVPAPRLPTRIESALSFRVVGSRVEMSYFCPANADCSAGPHLIARRHARWLLVQETFVPDAVRYYTRVPDPRHP